MKRRRTTPRRVLKVRCGDLYPFTVIFYVGPKPGDGFVGDLLKREKLWNGKGREPHLSADGCRAEVIHCDSGSFVWFQSANVNDPDFISSLAHELVHVNSNFSYKIGERIEYAHDEMFAYFSGYVAKRFAEHYLQ